MNALFEKVAEINVSSVMITDVDAKIVYVNGAFTENTGYTAGEIIGKKPNILKSDYADEITDYDDLWKTLIAGEEWNGEFYNKDKYGEHFWEFARISPAQHNGKIYYVAVKQNITRLKVLEEKLSFLYSKAETLPCNGTT